MLRAPEVAEAEEESRTDDDIGSLAAKDMPRRESSGCWQKT